MSVSEHGRHSTPFSILLFQSHTFLLTNLLAFRISTHIFCVEWINIYIFWPNQEKRNEWKQKQTKKWNANNNDNAEKLLFQTKTNKKKSIKMTETIFLNGTIARVNYQNQNTCELCSMRIIHIIIYYCFFCSTFVRWCNVHSMLYSECQDICVRPFFIFLNRSSQVLICVVEK